MIEVSIDHKIMQKVMSRVADQLKNKIDLNPNHVKNLCRERYGIETIIGVENRDANIVVFKNQIACKLDFEVRFPMSVLITTKDNLNRTLPDKDAIMADDDDLPNDFDDTPEDLDEILTEDLDEIPEDLEDMRAELDEIMEEELDDIPEVLDGIKAELDMSELKEEYLIDNDSKKPINRP